VDAAASRTALMIAAYRARATALGSLIDDPWAAALAGDDGMAIAAAMDRLQPQFELWVAVRTAYLDRAVARRVAGPNGKRPGLDQVVILGAGLDTRAARLATDGVRFFEVDHPGTQAEKRRRLEALPDFPQGAARLVACDFEHDDFLDRLAATGFDPEAPAVIVWEGVTCYLTEGAVRTTLRRVATGCHPRTTILFDIVGKKMAAGAISHEEDRQTASMVDTLGEPLKFGIDDPLPLLFEEGFRKVRVVSFDEAALDLTGTYDRDRRWRFQSIVTASVAAPTEPSA
jgi:methyltransferase (TIGR00027 family)